LIPGLDWLPYFKKNLPNELVNITRWIQDDRGGDFIKIRNHYTGTRPVKLAAIQHLWV